MTVGGLVPVLQTAIGPAILISGAALLVLSMTNRLGRVIDRSRDLARQLDSASSEHAARIEAQLDVLTVRARLVRLEIALAALSVLLASVLVVVLFLTALLGLEAAFVLAALFIACMAALVASVVVFLRDIDLSLRALALELELHRRGRR